MSTKYYIQSEQSSPKFLTLTKNGKYDVTTKPKLRFITESKKEAMSVKDNLPRTLKKFSWQVKEIVEQEVIPAQIESLKEIASAGKEEVAEKAEMAEKAEVAEQIPNMKAEPSNYGRNYAGKHDDPLLIETLAAVRAAAAGTDALYYQREQTKQQLAQYNDAVFDMLHYLEFSNLDAASSCIFANKLKTLLRNRRILKNRSKVQQYLDTYNVQSLKSLDHKVSNMADVSYHPRVLSTLFEHGVRGDEAMKELEEVIRK